MHAHTARNQDPTPYFTGDDVIAQALQILAGRLNRGPVMNSPQNVKDFCRLKFGGLEHEEFSVMFLDTGHALIAHESMFRGTVAQASVYPREIVKRALALNAAAVILAHNHPSGSVEPSRADEHLTQSLKSALALVDVRVLDHMVVSATGSVSFAERGLL